MNNREIYMVVSILFVRNMNQWYLGNKHSSAITYYNRDSNVISRAFKGWFEYYTNELARIDREQ